jgi:hypothetical protein
MIRNFTRITDSSHDPASPGKPPSSLQDGGGAAGAGEDDGFRPAHLSAWALPRRSSLESLGVALKGSRLASEPRLRARSLNICVLIAGHSRSNSSPVPPASSQARRAESFISCSRFCPTSSWSFWHFYSSARYFASRSARQGAWLSLISSRAFWKASSLASYSLFSLTFICSSVSLLMRVFLAVVLCPPSGPRGFR